MKIAIGCDHGGYLLKQDILIWLEEHNIDFEDVGCYSTESVDYPMYGEKVGRMVASGQCDKGIVICTTGIGISISGVSSTFAPSSACKPKNANVIRHRMTVTGRRRENFVKLIILRSPRCQLLPHCLHCSLRSPQKNH
mgnify:CR=1 FL=1